MALNVAALVTSGRTLAAGYRAGFDTYQIRRPVNTPDGAGGWTVVEGIVENGNAILVPSALQGGERVRGEVAGATNRYELRNMPYNSLVAESDTVTIGARVFEVVGVERLAALAVVVTAKLEERV